MSEKIDSIISKIKELEIALQNAMDEYVNSSTSPAHNNNNNNNNGHGHKFNKKEVERYSRQMILPEIGVQGQLKLREAKVVIIGAGGLGCPAAIYLAGAGVGHIGIVDYDKVELSNLHRQILHRHRKLNITKSTSAANALISLNNEIQVTPYNVQVNSSNIYEIIDKYDYVVDATDNAPTRYLLNDACILRGKPLVSGSAVKFEGQLTVYNYKNGPCYRCIYPIPPPAEAITNCGDGGVMGPVPGVIGTLQSMEIIKMILDMDGVLSERLLLYDGIQCTFMNVKLRGKRAKCDICSDTPVITELIDYEMFCGMPATDNAEAARLTVLNESDRITVMEFNRINQQMNKLHELIDVRSSIEFEMCNIKNSINIPINTFLEMKIDDFEKYQHKEVYIVCRRGNDSQLAVQHMKVITQNKIAAKDIIGGLTQWAKNIDYNFPIY